MLSLLHNSPQSVFFDPIHMFPFWKYRTGLTIWLSFSNINISSLPNRPVSYHSLYIPQSWDKVSLRESDPIQDYDIWEPIFYVSPPSQSRCDEQPNTIKKNRKCQFSYIHRVHSAFCKLRCLIFNLPGHKTLTIPIWSKHKLIQTVTQSSGKRLFISVRSGLIPS
jgi:hypothetical protein